MENKKVVDERFYKKCEELLGVSHIYVMVYERRTRWNNRHPGNGRFPGWGIIRRYSSDHIQVCCQNYSKMFKSEEEVLEYIRSSK